MAKLDIDFVLLDESKVRYGFRALMSGGQLEDFKNNPIMLLQHNRPKEYAGADDIMLPIGRWYDIRIESNRLLAKPDFDDDDELAQRVQKKVEKKYLNGVSVWIDPIAVSDDPDVMLPGQTLPTFTKWEILEASIVDIPNCKNSLAIRNSAGNRIELSGVEGEQKISEYLKNLLPQKIQNMDKKLVASKLGIDENAADNVIAEKLSAIITEAAKVPALVTENTNLKNEVIKLKAAEETAKITALVDGAEAAGKIVATDKEKYTKLATADFDTTKQLLDGMKGYTPVAAQLAAGDADNKVELDGLIKLSGKELYMQGKLERLKTLSLEHFKPKYKEAFNVEYKD